MWLGVLGLMLILMELGTAGRVMGFRIYELNNLFRGGGER